jgi:serine/threonine protein phosphatase PrpC
LTTTKISYYGVYDGHGGVQVAQMLETLLHKRIVEDEAFAKGDFETAIRTGFAETDKVVIEAAAKDNWHCGSTVVVTIIHNGTLYLGNVGDAEAILGRRENGQCKPVQLSHKHKPTDPDERDRIKKVGGYIVLGRVMGSLAVARALGDKDFKKPFNNADGDYVSGEPFQAKLQLTPEDEFVIVSCDGLW